MHFDKDHVEEGLISLILRVSMASLFLIAGVDKFMKGLNLVSESFTMMFKDTLLPPALVGPYAYFIPFAEVLIALWLLSGIKLRAAWVFTAFLLISLSFGMVIAKQYATAADNYAYVLMACAGLYFSRYDCCALGKCKK